MREGFRHPLPGYGSRGARDAPGVLAGLLEAIAGMMRPAGAGATAGVAPQAAGLVATPTRLLRPLTPLLALPALVRLLSPTTPLPAIHDPADRDAAPQAAGDCHRLRMRRVTLPASELGDGRGAVQPGYLFGRGASASVEGRGILGKRFRGAGCPDLALHPLDRRRPISRFQKKFEMAGEV